MTRDTRQSDKANCRESYLPYGLALWFAFATEAGEGWPGNIAAEDEPPLAAAAFGEEATGAEETFIAATPPEGGSAALRASMEPPRIMRPIKEAKKVVIILGFTCKSRM